MPGVVKTPAGGITTLDFKVIRFIGLSGIMLLTSLNKSVVKGREFTISSTSISKACNDSPLGLVSWVFNKEAKISLALLICLFDLLLVHFRERFLKFGKNSNKVNTII